MKTKNLSRWLILLLCACVVTFYSCDKSDYDQKDRKEMKKQEEDKKQEEEKKKQTQLTLDPTSITLTPLVTKNVHIKNGTAPYEVKGTNNKVAIVKVYDKENYIAVTGTGEGKIEIVVTDKNMKTGNVTVTTVNH